MVRMFWSAILLLHRGLGARRVIAAYIFFAFALLSLVFTVSIPLGADFLPATTGAKVQSRLLTVFMLFMNLGVYGMIMNWHRISAGVFIIRIGVIILLLYFDISILGRVVYTLIRNGNLF